MLYITDLNSRCISCAPYLIIIKLEFLSLQLFVHSHFHVSDKQRLPKYNVNQTSIYYQHCHCTGQLLQKQNSNTIARTISYF
jgi:hypothetical protein